MILLFYLLSDKKGVSLTFTPESKGKNKQHGDVAQVIDTHANNKYFFNVISGII